MSAALTYTAGRQLDALLAMAAYPLAESLREACIDAGYCLDAPAALAAGSHLNINRHPRRGEAASSIVDRKDLT